MKVMDIFDVLFLLLAGTLYYLVFPGIPIADGMKPYVSLAILFILLIMKKDFRLILLSAFFLGLLTTMTSSLAEGAWINLLEKPITAILLYYILGILEEKLDLGNICLVLLFSFIGVISSGFIFVGLIAIFHTMPASLLVLVKRAIVPSVLLNLGATYVLYVSFRFANKAVES